MSHDLAPLISDFSQGYRLGWANCADVEWRRGYDACAEDYTLKMGAVSTLLKATRPFREVEEQRARPLEPCSSPRCRPVPRCSACIRARVVQSNLQRFGQPDRPGRPAVTA